MAPVYEFSCGKCKDDEGRQKVVAVFRPFSDSGKPQRCPDCGGKTDRLYSFTRPKEFNSYFDEKFGTVVSSGRQERSLMKKHGQIYTSDTPAYSKFKEQRRIAKRKPYYVIPGVKSVKIDRD